VCLLIEVTGQLWRIVEPELASLGFELVEIECVPHGRGQIVRIYMDKTPGRISLDDCAMASRVLSPVLDLHDVVPGGYILEVSSPGLDRPVRKPEHFVKYTGEQVKLTTHAPVGGRTRFTGVIRGHEDGMIVLEVDGQTVSIHGENLKKARLNR